jgi:hypothetical protein
MALERFATSMVVKFDMIVAFALAGVVSFDVVTIDYSPPNCKRNRGLISKITKIIAETRKRRAKR